MKNKNGFTLVELLAVIAILALLVLITMPKILDLYSNMKKDTFLTNVKELYKTTQGEYLTNELNDKKTNVISSETTDNLNLNGKDLDYYIKVDEKGNIEYIEAYDGEYCIQSNKTVYELDNSDVKNGPCEGKRPTKNEEQTPMEEQSKTSIAYLDKEKLYNFVSENEPTEIYFVTTGRNSGSDISDNPNSPIYAWMEENKMYISNKKANEKILAPSDSSFLFSGSHLAQFKNVKTIDLKNLDTSKVTNMTRMFMYTAMNVTTPVSLDLSTFDTSNVTSMPGMFTHFASNSNSVNLNVNNFDTSKVTDISYMFLFFALNAKTWNIDGISSWNVSNVTNMDHTFYAIGYESRDFNLDLSGWDTKNVTNMSSMFEQASYHDSTPIVKIPKINGNTTSSIKGKNKSASLPYGRKFTLVD